MRDVCAQSRGGGGGDLQNHTNTWMSTGGKGPFVIRESNVLGEVKRLLSDQSETGPWPQNGVSISLPWYNILCKALQSANSAIVKWSLINNTCAHLTCALNGKMA